MSNSASPINCHDVAVTLVTAIMVIAIIAIATPEYQLLNAFAYKPQAVVQLYPTLPSYYAGVPITISGRVIPANTNETAVIQVYNPRGNLYHAAPVSIASNGEFSTQFVIGGVEGIDGSYRAVATYEHVQSAVSFSSIHSNALATSTVNDLHIARGSTMVVGGGQILVLSGVSTIDGTLAINLGGKVINHSIVSGNGGNIQNFGTFRNTNTINLNGCTLTMVSTSLMINSGKMIVTETDNCSPTLTNSGYFNNQGILETRSTATTNPQGAIINDKTINNLEFATIHVYGTLQNNGKINNLGEMSGGNSTIVNSGLISNYCGSTYQTTLSATKPSSECAT